MSPSSIAYSFCFLLVLNRACAFIPHPLVASGALSRDSITHAEIAELGLIRSVARYLYDTRIRPRNINESIIKEEEYFTRKHTIDDLYELAYPHLTKAQLTFYSLPLKFIVDSIMTQDVLVDFNEKTKKLSEAHFDNELFLNSSRRIIRFRQKIVNDTTSGKQDLTNARELLGQLFHTLQDFYSHSNWIEMGNTDINELIGINETIGRIARPDQSTCTSEGCTKIEKTCTFWQQITLRNCPLVYYDCKNNILPEINAQRILTSGYAANDLGENNEVLEKPRNVEKCSHGSVLDASSHIPAIGGINKDSYSLVFSPHSNLHKQAADMAVKATERFLNDLRRDIGDHHFDRLLVINPNDKECQQATDLVNQGKRFRFFVPNLAVSLADETSFLTQLKTLTKKFFGFIKSIFTGDIFKDDPMSKPTYDLSDKNVNVEDSKNFRAAPYVLQQELLKRKRRSANL